MSHTTSLVKICNMPDIDVLNPPKSSVSPKSRKCMWTSVPIFIRGRSPTSQPRKVAILRSMRARILSAASFLSTGHHQPVVLQPQQDDPDVLRFNHDGVSKCDPIWWKIFLNPHLGGSTARNQQEQTSVVL